MRTTRVPFPRGGRRLLAPLLLLLLLLAYLPGWAQQAQPIGSLLTSRNTAQAWRLALLAWLVPLLTWLAPPLKAQSVRWQKTYGLPYTSGSSTQTSNDVNAAVATPDGGFLLAGQTTQIIPGTTTTGYYGLLVKVDVSGQVLWQKTYGQSYTLTYTSGTYTRAQSNLTAAVATPDGGFLLAGSTYQTKSGVDVGVFGLLVKVDADGQVLWQKTYGQTFSNGTCAYCLMASNSLNAVVATPDGGFLLAGGTTQLVSGSGHSALGGYGLLIKVDATGNMLWQQTYGQTYTYNNSPANARTILNAAITTPDGGFLLAGYTTQDSPTIGSPDKYGLVVKVDAAGNTLWQKTCGLAYTYNNYNTTDNALNAAVATPDGGFLLVGQTTQIVPGTTTSGTYGLVVKMNANGSVLSQQTAGLTSLYTWAYGSATTAANNFNAAVAIPDGGFLLVGKATQTVAGSTRNNYGLLVKVDAGGRALWPAPRTVPPAAGLTNYAPKAVITILGGGVLLAGQVNQSPGTPAGQYGWAALVDSGLLLQKADGTAQAAGKPFRLLWQPVLTVGGLDSLARPQLRGTVTTFQGGRVLLPPSMQVTDAKGFYFFQEASPAAGQDTLFYGLYVRNTPLANGATDDTLRHLYQCRRTFGSQAGPRADSLQPLALGTPPAGAAQTAVPVQRETSALAPRPSPVQAGRRPTMPRRRLAPLATPQPALLAPRQRAH
ncbi:hypothetical protein IC235_20715 [Hymenobacter sp. BT664]|uniref:Bulb-type lectin domain-containing protein n=1 Tax=Hymenobacter montanus TaxID=2771359 RepID=A0A927BG86_9BACT|nr:hypothetical protein [Hymenobacter montanus]MBD2770317.1 hypothetical protein [Hymenobacter montanus]